MAKFCPSCGFRVDDDTALFCNKCGFPFPREEPRPSRSVVVKPMVSPPVPAPRPKAPRTPTEKRRGIGAFFSFDILIIGRYLRPIYIAGAVLIILFSLIGITGGFAIKGEVPANMSYTNTSAVVQHSGSSPLFWIGVLIAGSLLWRIFCEIMVVAVRHAGTGSGPVETMSEVGEEEEYPEAGYEEPAPQVECPRCRKIVTTDQLRECGHCGVQGCVNCIRPMGLLKKTLTCRECFEAK